MQLMAKGIKQELCDIFSSEICVILIIASRIVRSKQTNKHDEFNNTVRTFPSQKETLKPSTGPQ